MARTWEIEGGNGMPTDLVREQDFILRVRRLHRLAMPHLAVNLVLTAIGALAKNRHTLEDAQNRLKEFAKVTNATYAEMSNGDVFFIWEETGDAALLAERLVDVLPPEQRTSGNREQFLLTYHMPADYTALRERANHYVEIVQSHKNMPSVAPSDMLKSAAATGPLTPWSVDQIGKLLDEIDIRTYARTQSIYRLEANGSPTPVSEEYFISFDDLRRERFPKLDLITPEHLFFSLCEMMDQRLLTSMTANPAAITNRPLHLNLSVASVIGAAFAQFTHSIPRDKRGLLTFELHRGDLFQDFARTLSAIELLHREGFKVGFDSVTPDMLPYLNVASFNLDFIKLNVSRDRVALLNFPEIRAALQKLDLAKVIFFRCDNEQAFKAGRELGIQLFQGWHIDDLAHPGQSHRPANPL